MQSNPGNGASVGSPYNQAAVDERKRVRQANAKRREDGLEALKLEGNEAFKSGDYKKAVSLYVAAIEKYGQKPALCSNLAAALSKLELWEDADWAATFALKANPRMNKARFRRAMARKALKRWEASLRDLEEIIAIDPACLEAISELVVVRPRYQRWEENDEPDEDSNSDYIHPVDLAYPRRNEPPFEYESDSDTEDCRHQGNGTACRFYNHSGCSRGDECAFSHAPDDKSVRDDLGKNVCVHYLIGDCKYGDVKCIYSHDKRYLPADGWWTKPESVSQVRLLLGECEPTEEQAALAEPFYHHIPLGRTIAKHTLKALDRSRLQRAAQRAQSAKQATPIAKPLPVPTLVPSSKRSQLGPKPAQPSPAAKPAPPPAAPDTDRFILLISLEHEDWFNYTPIVRPIKEKRNVAQAFKPNEAIAKLASPALDGVIVTDAGIAKQRSSAVLAKLVEYVKAGGTAVIGYQFSNFIAGDNFEQFFKAFGLSWQRGSYHRTTHYLKNSNPVASGNPSLAPSYSMKALHADGVSDDQILYGPTRDSVTQSMVFSPRRVDKFSEAPVVIGKSGTGYLGYIGDVNAEKETNKVYSAMLKILDGPSADTGVPVAGPSAPPASADQASTLKTSASKASVPLASKTTFSTINAPQKSVSQSETPSNQPSMAAALPSPAVSKDAPLIVVLLGDQAKAKFTKPFGKQIIQLEQRTKVEVVTQRSVLEQCLMTRSIRGVYIADAGILSSDNSSVLLPILASYVKSGGTVLAGGLFPSSLNLPNSRTFFKAFGLAWEMGKYERAVYEVVSTSEVGKKNPELAEIYSMKAVNLKGINHNAPLYTRLTDEDDTDEDSAWASASLDAPVLCARIGSGSVGYVGDVNGEDETTNVVLAMFNLIHPDAPAPAPKRKSRPFALLFSFANESDTKRACNDFLEGLKNDLEVVFGLSTERMTDLIDSPDLKAIIVNSTKILSPDETYLLSRIVSFVHNGGTVILLQGFAQVSSASECRPSLMDNFGLDWTTHAKHYPLEPGDVALNAFNFLVQGNDGKLPPQPELGRVTFATSNPHHLVYLPKKIPCPDVWDPMKGLYAGPCLYAPVGEKGRVGFVSGTEYSGRHYDVVLRAMVGTL